MMTLRMNTAGAAFHTNEDDPSEIDLNACAEMLEIAAERLRAGYSGGNLIDYNGNRVGGWQVGEIGDGK